MGKIHQFHSAVADMHGDNPFGLTTEHGPLLINEEAQSIQGYDLDDYATTCVKISHAIGSYGMLLCGLLFVWPSYTSSLYTDKNTTLLSAPMTHIDISLIGSLPSLGAMLGTLLSSKIINYFGRHKGGLILILPFLLSWTMIILTSSSTVVIIARFISGFPCGAFLVYGPIFISEVVEESIRGLLATGPIICYCLGALMSYIFGWVLPYHYILWVNIAFGCIGLIIIMMATESPVWLVKQKRETDACFAFAHYRGVSPESKTVLEEISRLKAQIMPSIELRFIMDGNTKTEDVEKEKLNINEGEIPKTHEKETTLKMIFSSPSTRRAFIVTGLTLFLQIMMGLIVVLVYAKEIFSNAVPSLSPHLCSVILAITLFLGSLTSAMFSDKFGRRILIILSSMVVALCLISMGLLLQTKVMPPWTTVILILVYCYSFKFGAGSVPYVLLAEVFVPEVQSTAATLLTECVWLTSFIQLWIFPFIVRYFGVHGAFYCFSVFGILDALVGIFLLPETKGLTNSQIQEAFLNRRKVKVIKM